MSIFAGRTAGASTETLIEDLSTTLAGAFATTFVTAFAPVFAPAFAEIALTLPTLLLVDFAATFEVVETTFAEDGERDPVRPSGLLFIGL